MYWCQSRGKKKKLGHDRRSRCSGELSRIGRSDHFYDPTQLNWKRSELAETREPVELGRVVDVIGAPDPTHLSQLSWVESTQLKTFRTCWNSWTSWVELSRVVEVIGAPDPTQPVELSWIGSQLNKRPRSTYCTGGVTTGEVTNYWQTRSTARPFCDSRATCCDS